MGYHHGLSGDEPNPVTEAELKEWGMPYRSAFNLVKRSLEGKTITPVRKVRKNRWDAPENRLLRERVLAFVEDDDISLYSPRTSDSVSVDGEPVRIRTVFIVFYKNKAFVVRKIPLNSAQILIRLHPAHLLSVRYQTW